MKFKAIALCAVMALGLSGCANPYAQFYQPRDNVSTPRAPVGGPPRVVTGSGDFSSDVYRYYEEGYGLIGVASFTGPVQSQNSALAQAKKVGAEIVVVASRYRNTQSGVMPLTTPTSSTSYTSGTMNAYGSRGGYGYGSYSGTTTTYGTETTYIPYSVDQYEQGALFFAPLQRRGAGVMFGRMSDEQRRTIGSNSGVQILAVRKGSPAFTADIIPGDVVTSINGASVFDLESFRRAADGLDGQKVEVVLYRGPNRIVKTVQAQDSW